VLVQDESLENADSFSIAAVLARVCRELSPDLVFFGKHAIGVDNGQVPSIVAEILDLPQVSVVIKLELQDRKFRAEREIEGAREIVEGSLPAVFTAQKDLNTPRYASLKGIMAAKKKTIAIRTRDSLGLTPEDPAQDRATGNHPAADTSARQNSHRRCGGSGAGTGPATPRRGENYLGLST
jgi:electron transfer flavoprotein beta subunit